LINKLKFRGAIDADMPFLANLRERTMRAHIERSGCVYNEKDQIQRIGYCFGCAQIIMLNENDIGLLKLDQSADPWDLIQIQIMPDFQGRGIGKQIISKVLGDARMHGVSVALSVLKGNPAMKLYDRLGFRVVAEKEHAFLMECSNDFVT
jgi:ribosomal protein S18 acetylase RimI-like enzyme